MRIRLTEGDIVEVDSAFVYTTVLDDNVLKENDFYGMRAMYKESSITWLFGLNKTNLSEAKEKVSIWMDKLLEDGWIDMTGIPYTREFFFDEDEYIEEEEEE